ncbi:Pathogenesis-related protein 1 [Linum grandiflorum]
MTGQLTILIIALLSVLHFTAAQNSPQDYINAHNRARAAVGVGRMRWDNRVAAFARDYGNKIKANCDFKHSGGPYGENLAFGRPDITGTKSVQMLGCARVKCNGNKGTIVICNYSPPGNFRGRRPYTCRNSLAASFDEFIDQYV